MHPERQGIVGDKSGEFGESLEDLHPETVGTGAGVEQRDQQVGVVFEEIMDDQPTAALRGTSFSDGEQATDRGPAPRRCGVKHQLQAVRGWIER